MRNIELNFQRLSGLEYSIEKVFRDASYDWPGDWEGRALLAFCCHYEISKKAIPCMHLMMQALPQKTNSKSYFGKVLLVKKVLKIYTMYEAPFCCTMRYAEGLLEYTQNQSLFAWDSSAKKITDDLGRRFIDDKLLVEYHGKEEPIFSCNEYSYELSNSIELTI